MRHALAAAALVSVPLLAGCYDLASSARVRAAHEFDCASDQVRVEPRDDISEDTVDVSACGHVARYTCPPRGRSELHPRTCVREPTDTE